MKIENLITLKVKRDQRQKFIRMTIWGLLVGSFGSLAIFDQPRTSPQPLQKTIEVKAVENTRQSPFCYDPITCIRDIGEQMGFANQEIIMAIKIAKCESGLKPDALNKNKNGTFDMGVMQINDVHSKRISRKDRMDFEKNIRFAWTLRKEQGHWGAWSCYKKVKNL